MTDNEKGRPRQGDLSIADSSHLRDYVVTNRQATEPMAALFGWDCYPTPEEAAPVGGLQFPAPRGGYVAVFRDGEVWDVAGFDLRGNALVEIRGGGLVRANAYPTFQAEGFADLLGVTA